MKQIGYYDMVCLTAKNLNKWFVTISNPYWNNVVTATWSDDIINNEFKTKLINLYGIEEKNKILFDFSDKNIYSFDYEKEAKEFFQIFNTGKLYSSYFYTALISPHEGIVDENT